MDESRTVELPIDGVLDLHTFDPREVRDLVPEYLAACRSRGILNARIIHGKGTGALRRMVHAILARLPEVSAFRVAGEDCGGWGATLVELEGLDADDPRGEPLDGPAAHGEDRRALGRCG